MFAVLALALLAAAAILQFSQPVATAGRQGTLALAVEVLAFALTGALIVTGRPHHPIGWIYVGSAQLMAVGALALTYSVLAQEVALPGGSIAAVAFVISWFGGNLLPITVGLLLFPTGSLPSARWRVVVAITAVGYLGFLGSNALAERTGSDPLHAIAGTGLVAVPVAVLASVWSLVRRWQSARGAEREQLKWAGAAALLLALDLVALIILALIGLIPPSGGVMLVALALGIALLPIAVTIAILRFRLYDIDLLISQTLVYASLTAILGAGYFASVILLQRLLAPITAGSEAAVATSTLVIVGVFNPVRRSTRGFVDRRFYRPRYDAARTLDTFSAQLRDEVDLDSLSRELLATVTATMQPAQAGLWLRPATVATPAGAEQQRRRFSER